MPSQNEKVEAHASHLLDGFIHLREKYAMLQPMLFSPEVTAKHGGQKKARGFIILRHSLFLSCAQDIAKLCIDADKRTPSVRNLIASLEDHLLRDSLRDRYAIWRLPPSDEQADPEIAAAIKRLEQREEAERKEQFDKHYERLVECWAELSSSQILEAFRTLRDKVSAHTEIRFVADKYQLIDIGTLGIKWGDLKVTIDRMQKIVELLGLIVRNAGFAWDGLEQQLTKASSDFWGGSDGNR